MQATIDRMAAQSVPARVCEQIVLTKVDRELAMKRLSAKMMVIFLLSYINLYIYSIFFCFIYVFCLHDLQKQEEKLVALKRAKRSRRSDDVHKSPSVTPAANHHAAAAANNRRSDRNKRRTSPPTSTDSPAKKDGRKKADYSEEQQQQGAMANEKPRVAEVCIILF